MLSDLPNMFNAPCLQAEDKINARDVCPLNYALGKTPSNTCYAPTHLGLETHLTRFFSLGLIELRDRVGGFEKASNEGKQRRERLEFDLNETTKALQVRCLQSKTSLSMTEAQWCAPGFVYCCLESENSIKISGRIWQYYICRVGSTREKATLEHGLQAEQRPRRGDPCFFRRCSDHATHLRCPSYRTTIFSGKA